MIVPSEGFNTCELSNEINCKIQLLQWLTACHHIKKNCILKTKLGIPLNNLSSSQHLKAKNKLFCNLLLLFWSNGMFGNYKLFFFFYNNDFFSKVPQYLIGYILFKKECLPSRFSIFVILLRAKFRYSSFFSLPTFSGKKKELEIKNLKRRKRVHCIFF